jgi:C-methyltransferase C-terminal domain/Putative zinc binding domain/Methyltransferase domain
MKCRHCGSELSLQMVDLGAAPPSNAFRDGPNGVEQYYPLQVLVCTECWLAQTNLDLFKLDYESVFVKDYPYFSSTSPSFVAHAKKYVEDMTKRFELGKESLTIEVGSNDGYLLQHMKTPCCGIEPTATGEKAEAKGILTFRRFFTEEWAKSMVRMGLPTVGPSLGQGKADLMICNNVLAHVPDINDFVKGFTALLKDTGVATFEFPHLLSLVQNNQFDTIYHEHYSYLSLTAVKRIFKANGLHIFDVECLPVHGGSLRVYAQKIDGGKREHTDFVRMILDREEEAGIKTAKFYTDFQVAAERVKNNLLVFLLQAKQLGRTVAAFGAAAKGNTLLNFAGVRSDLLQYVVDDTPSKQGKFLPGSRIWVKSNFTTKPDYVLILPWNFKTEIIKMLEPMREWGCKFVVAVPSLEIL